MKVQGDIGNAGTAFGDYEKKDAHAEAAGDALERHVLLARRQAPPAWLDERLSRIEGLAKLEENWDSYGARPMDARSILRAKTLLQRLSWLEGIERPAVTASPNGNVGLCWEDTQRSLDVEVYPNDSFKFAYLSECDAVETEGATMIADELAYLLTRF